MITEGDHRIIIWLLIIWYYIILITIIIYEITNDSLVAASTIVAPSANFVGTTVTLDPKFACAWARVRATGAFVRTCTWLYYTGMFPVGDTSCRTLIDVCVCVCVCVSLSADMSLNCAKNDSTDYPEILWVCWVWRCHECIKFWLRTN